MIDLFDIRYVRLGTRDLESTSRFMTEIIGLELVRQIDVPGYKANYFKSDSRDHTLCWFEGDPDDHTVGFELNRPEDIDTVAAQLENAGYPVQWGTPEDCELRRVRNFISTVDPNGNKIDIVARPFHSAKFYHGTRDAGITGFSHIGLHTRDPLAAEEFWTRLLSARVSDWIGDLALLRVSTVHHAMALFPSPRSGVQHINHQVKSIDDVMRSYYFLKERGVPIQFGPGRHITSTAMFLYFEGPEGMTFEYSHGVGHILPEQEATYRPRQFAVDRYSICYWGALPQGQSSFDSMKPPAKTEALENIVSPEQLIAPDSELLQAGGTKSTADA